jgi:hypothetical protein
MFFPILKKMTIFSLKNDIFSPKIVKNGYFCPKNVQKFHQKSALPLAEVLATPLVKSIRILFTHLWLPQPKFRRKYGTYT